MKIVDQLISQLKPTQFFLETKEFIIGVYPHEWKRFTNYPFVFACWVTNKKIPIKFINEFNNSLKFGLDNLDIALKRKSNKFKTTIDKENYLKNIIKYNMDNKMKSAINFFLNKKIF